MSTIVLRNVKGSPLTNQEVDDNFNNLNTEVGLKLDASVYTATDVFNKVKSLDGAGSGLDADTLDGYSTATDNTVSTVVVRDSNGDFSAGTITAVALAGPLTGNVLGNVTGNCSGTSLNVTGVVAIVNGGTGSTSASSARTNLGLGTIATQASSLVSITGGTITGITDITIADGGTGASNAAAARTNLGLTIGSDVQPYSNELTGIAGVSTTGLYARTGAATVSARTLTAGASISITNGDGVAGNPTIGIPSSANLSVASVSSSGAISGTTLTLSGAISGVTSYNASGNITTTGVGYFAGIDCGTGGYTGSVFVKSGSSGVGDIGQSANRFGTIYGTATSAKYADLAEKYTTDKEYETGTVLVVSYEDSGAEATASWLSGQRVLGVVSAKPAFLMNDEAPGQALALRGRVPVKVVGPIRKGQPLISNQNGQGFYGDHQNSFAIALESNPDSGVKLVECVIL